MKVVSLLFCSLALVAQTKDGAPRYPFTVSIADLPSAASYSGYELDIDDGSTSSDCTVGGGSYAVKCRSNGSVWSAIGGAGGTSGLAASKGSSTVLNISAGIARLGTIVTSFSAASGTISGSSASSTAYGYISSGGILTIGHNGAATITCSGCTTATGVTAFPAGSIPLFTWGYTSNVWDSSGTSKIPVVSRSPLAAGSGISITEDSGGLQTIASDATPVSIGFYYPYGYLTNNNNPTTAFSANETRWQYYTQGFPITLNGIGVRAWTGIGASKGLKFAIANTSGTILYTTATQGTCASTSDCRAAFASPITLQPGSYYLGITTDSTTFTTGQYPGLGADGDPNCALIDAATAPILAGTGTAGSGSSTSVAFGASMGSLTAFACNSGSNTTITRRHFVYFY